MFIKIAPRVNIYITNADVEFIKKHLTETFKSSDLNDSEQTMVKRLADKAIFVRKNLDNDTQYMLNKHIYKYFK
jgi:hypothetical protein